MLAIDNLLIEIDDFRLSAHLEYAPASVTALIGPSGSGKSTLLSAIAGFIAPQSGHVAYDEQNLNELSADNRPVSILFQDNNLFPHLTVAQNVGLALGPRLRLSNDECGLVRDVLEKVDLAGMEDRKPAALSGGQQSRVAIARTLLQDKPVVLLDEPFAALGPGLKAEMLKLVRDELRAAGKTVIMVTHEPDDAERFADYVALVGDGEVQPPIATNALFADPPQAFIDYIVK